MNVLVIDVGGSHVKLARTDIDQSRRFDSGHHLTPAALLDQVHALTADWEYEVVSLGIPGAVGPNGPTAEPGNLGDGWVGFDFQHGFERPVRIVNDAAMQALGAYDGGRMLFLGLGTGLGSTLIAERVVIPLELGALRDLGGDDHQFMGIRLGKEGLEKSGQAAWQKLATQFIDMLKGAFSPDYIVLGGGHAQLLDPLPQGVRRGGNDDAFTGRFRLWEEIIEPHDAPASTAFRVVR